jgi:hypothetical protein
MPRKTISLEAVATIGIDIGKNTFHLIGLDKMGAIVLRQKLSRNQVDTRLANMPRCLIGMEACVGAHHLSRQLKALGHDARLMPARYVRPYSKGQKNYSATRKRLPRRCCVPALWCRTSLRSVAVGQTRTTGSIVILSENHLK